MARRILVPFVAILLAACQSGGTATLAPTATTAPSAGTEVQRLYLLDG